MEKNISPLSNLYDRTAEELNFSILINNCCRELKNSNFYAGVPNHDKALADHFRSSGHKLHLKLSFPSQGSEVYAPVNYRSESLNHTFYFPIIERELAADEVKSIDSSRFMQLVLSEAKAMYPDINSSNIPERLSGSVENMAYYLRHFEESGSKINASDMSFIEAEQKLVTGHSFHPLTKSRQGFSEEDRKKYSPETNGKFQLHYFLIHPEYVTEESAEEKLFSQIFKEEFCDYVSEEDHTHNLMIENPSWKIVPVHPWEAKYLLGQPEVQEMHSKSLLHNLGPHGPLFTATSSVRTVYNPQSDWMYKFSLHVRITSAERINHLHELYRGYDFSRLLKTSMGEKLREQHPDIRFLNDPGFIAVHYNGRNIPGFNTVIRQNPFKNQDADKNVGLLASVCQQAVSGEPGRLANIIEQAALFHKKPVREIASEWFRKYLRMLLPASITMFEQYGFVCELHQQNILIEFDESYFPSKLYLRDNQSYLFRKGFEEQLCSVIPGLSEKGNAFLPDERLFILLSHYLIVSNIMSLVNTFGCNQLITERELIEVLYEEIDTINATSPNGFTNYLLTKRYWSIKGNLLTALRNIDGGGSPASVVHLEFPNLLHKHFFSDQLIFPEGKEVFYSRYFPKENITISLRPIDLDSDLEMLHEWFHREHAIKIWKMDWPVSKLETYFRTMIPGDMMHAYIGEANGEPTFYFEVYWATKDMVGDYYEVLPTDYGTHQYIAPTDPKKKYASPATQCMVDYVFAQPEVGKMVGEGSVDSLASMMNKAHVGFKVEKVIEMPHKKANLNFCYREWYWAKFPQNKDIKITPVAESIQNA